MIVAQLPGNATVSPLRLAPRYAGPAPDIANGGIVAGSLAQHLAGAAGSDGAVEVRIARPVPLDADLTLASDGVGAELRRDRDVLATAQPVTTDRTTDPAGLDHVGHVALADAGRAQPVDDVDDHPAPGCFVCGPANPRGLRLRPGRVPGRRLVATVWSPPVDLAGPDGVLLAPFVWAALDCPSWFGAADGRPALLGTMLGRQFGAVVAGEPVVVTGWRTGAEGRKTHAGSAIRTPDGRLLAAASSTWIHPKESTA